jgi:hypothetical protein
MKMNLRIHNRNHIIKSLLGNIEYMFTKLGLQPNELIVVNYHGTQKKFIQNFRRQIDFFNANFSIIAPEQITDFYSGKLNNKNKPLLLITFDDVIKNNLYAAEILDNYNIKALFFIVPEFIETPHEQQKEYFIKYIRPKINHVIDNKPEDFSALSWEDLKILITKGHKVGSHTQTHQLIAQKSTLENSINEIKNSKINIANGLRALPESINTFCSINNTLESISIKELQLIKENYAYHFTTFPGSNLNNSNPYHIKRSNIETYWLLGAIKYAIGRWDYGRWAAINKTYTEILKRVN